MSFSENISYGFARICLIGDSFQKVSQLQEQLSAVMTNTDSQLVSVQQELASRDASLKQLTKKLNE